MKKIMLRALHAKDCKEGDGNNVVTASYTRTSNIGGILARTTSSGSVFYGYDGGGNVVALTNNAGAQVGSYTYDAFGNTVATSGTAASENPYRFSTKEQIGGLVSYGFRFYSPGLGRWINRDPIAEAGGTNLYAFVGNDPVNGVDEYGLLGVAAQIGEWKFSSPFYGKGGPDFLFDSGSASNLGGDLEKGWYPAADGLNPLGDPYKDMNYWSNCDSNSQWSYNLGTVSQQSLVMAASSPQAIASAGRFAAARGVPNLAWKGFMRGGELTLSKSGAKPFARVNPWLNPLRPKGQRLPHYHRRPMNIPSGQSSPAGQGIGRHRPWQNSPTDNSWWSRF